MRLGVIFLSVLAITLAATLQQSYAASITWDGGGGDGLWSTPTNWSGDALPNVGDDVTILNAAVTMDTDVSGLNSLTLDGTTTLTIQPAFTLNNGGSLVVFSPSEIVNDGNLLSTNTIDVQGKLTNTNNVDIDEGTFSLDGIFDNYFGFQNRGLFTITTNGELNNYNSGTFDNDDAGTVNNHGTVNNFNAIKNYGIFNNIGTINNAGDITEISGSFTNTGTISNDGGTIIIDCDGIVGSGTISGGTITNGCLTTNNPPVITLSPDFSPPNSINGIGTEATSPTGTQIFFNIAAFDVEDGAPKPVACDHPSGSSFTVGIHENICTASDSQGAIATIVLLMTVIDTTPPQITVPADISEEAASPSGNIVDFNTYGGVSATDNGDPSPDVTCNPLSGSLFPIGTTTVECTANDMSGNTSPTSFLVVIHDNTAPAAPIIAGVSGLINDNTPTITGTAEAGATVTITLTGPTPTTLVVVADSLGNWSIVSTLLSDGPYTATAIAEDISGNPSGTSDPVLFTVDTIPPQTTITSGPSGIVLVNGATFVFTSDSPPSTFKCSLDGALYSSCTSPIDYLGLSEGTHTFAVNATDQAGNTDPSPASQTWIVDTTTTTPIISGPTGSITNPTPTITGTAEAGATVTITLTGPTPTTLVVVADSLGNWSIVSTLLSDGPYTATAIAEDISGHISGTSDPVTFTLTAPASNVVLSGIIRDFKIAHPDFEYKISDDDGIVKNTLQANEPVYNGNPTTITTTGLVNFNQWYNHVNTINQCTTHDITLVRDTAGIYSYSNTLFFPIDGQLFGNEGKPHNYHFTYQVYAQFVYQPGQTITMTGDDDIWVFIDNKLALDQGGVLPPRTGTINLDTLGLTAGQTYEFALFFAERHTVQSNLGMTTNIEFTPVAPLDCDAVDAVDDSAIIGTATTTLDVTNNDSGFTSIFSFTQPSNGVIAIVGSSLIYTPNPGFVGTDQFRYTIINANTGDTDSAIVSLVVTSGNVNGLFCEKPISAYSNVIIGTNANDNLVGTHGDDLIIGLGGNDKLIGLKGNDCLIGDTGNDILIGGPGDDYLLGGSGNDKLEGNHGNDKLYGQDGDDKIEGGDGNDYIDGGNHIQGDQCKGGSGTNTIVNCERHNSKDDD